MKHASILKGLLLVLSLSFPAMASAATGDFVVKAYDNSTSGGVGVDTFPLLAGQQFSVNVDVNDLWNAGALPRWSNADGLNQNLYYQAGTDPEVPVYSIGTQIGGNFGLWNQGGLSAAYGSLVGQIGSGNFFKIGTNYTGTAGDSGMLKLFYFDSNNYDNTGSIAAHVAAVPEAETYAMLLAGLGIMGFMVRRRRHEQV